MRRFLFLTFVVAWVGLLPSAAGNPGPVATRGLEPSATAPVQPREVSSMWDGLLEGKGHVPKGQPEDTPNYPAYKKLLAKEAATLSRGAVKALQTEPPAEKPPEKAPEKTRVDKVLVLLVEFAGSDTDSSGVTHVGPLHNQTKKPNPVDNTSFWIPDFSPEHYHKMLFDRTPGAASMANYYLEQSYGKFTVEGQVSGWISLPHSEWYYGADSPNGHDDLNGRVWRVIRDAVRVAGDKIPWKDFDQRDPFDVNGNGKEDEPDGYVDHLMVIHAGDGQESGGGDQVDDAIWSHSSFAGSREGDCPMGRGVPTPAGVCLGSYTIMPENGRLGVFAHEFGHDLGLPDLYDTSYRGDASTSVWTLMSGGSWLSVPGEAIGTRPSAMGPWEKNVLGWLEPLVIKPREEKRDLVIQRSASQGPGAKALRIDLPPLEYSERVNTPRSGNMEWYGGRSDMTKNNLIRSFDLRGVESAELRLWTWYEIEDGWDYGYVQVSTDGGASWTNLRGNVTTNSDPNGMNRGNGITGKSNGWVEAAFDLTPYTGQITTIRLVYETDESVLGRGWTVDDISIDGIGFRDDIEQGAGSWQAEGWSIIDGNSIKTTDHYYLLEWRQFADFDASLANIYAFGGLGAAAAKHAQFFSYNPGLLVWYRNTRYGDNRVGRHPGGGFLLVVDSRPDPVMRPIGLPWRTRVQVADAPFSLEPSGPMTLETFGQQITLPSLPAFPVFDDSRNYWAPEKPDSGVRVTSYGLQVVVKSQSADKSSATLDVLWKQ